MRTMLNLATLATLATLAIPSTGRASSRRDTLNSTIHRVEQMVWDTSAQRMAKREGLSLVNVTWEDTGRTKGSAWGPNISDMTIGVRDSAGRLHPMPVFRFDNFRDKTADLRVENMWVKTGNETGRRLVNTPLVDLLSDVRDYLHDPRSFRHPSDSLLHARDSHFLVSAQACFLPISRRGEATFTPVIYNYQSRPGDPAVLTIVATREGTSVQVVENDSGYMSEVLYFNEDGQRAPFTATRLSTFQANGGDSTTSASEAREDAGLDVVLVIQVPLKQRRPRRAPVFGDLMPGVEMEGSAPTAGASSKQRRSDTEAAVISHGATEGPFKEVNDLRIERDARFPIRITAQFYKATSTGVVTASDVAKLRQQIDRVYAGGDAVGSLVTSGRTSRTTEWAGRPDTSFTWARPVWEWHKAK